MLHDTVVQVRPRDASSFGLRVLDIGDFLSMELPTREVLLEPWLPAQGLVMVHAMRGVGKTFFALHAACAIASGTEFLGWKAAKAHGVAYLDGEMPATVLQERLSRIIASGAPEPVAPFRILTPDLQPKTRPAFNLTSSEDQDAIENYLDGVSLIVVDNISTLCRGGRENEAEAWIPMQEWALRQRASGKSVLFIHHAGKDGHQRGTSKKEDVLDTVIALRRPKDYDPKQGARFEIHFEKARGFFGEASAPFEAMLTADMDGNESWTCKTLEDSLLEQVIAMHKDGLTQTEIAEEVGRHKSNVSRMLARARTEGLVNE